MTKTLTGCCCYFFLGGRLDGHPPSPKRAGLISSCHAAAVEPAEIQCFAVWSRDTGRPALSHTSPYRAGIAPLGWFHWWRCGASAWHLKTTFLLVHLEAAVLRNNVARDTSRFLGYSLTNGCSKLTFCGPPSYLKLR